MPSSRQVRITRTAISPRLAIRTFPNTVSSGSAERTPYPTAVSEPTRTWTISRFAELDSTNRYLLDEARAGAPEGAVVVADHQTSGRGRLDRSWEAPPGSSLLVSVLLRPALGPGHAHVVVMAAALALADAVGAVAGFTAELKWPNDLVVGDRKLAGLLAEREPGAGGSLAAVIVGAGVNVQWTTFPPELADLATACNLEAGRAVDRDALLEHYLEGSGTGSTRSPPCRVSTASASAPSAGACASSKPAARSRVPPSTCATRASSSCATTTARSTWSRPPTSSTSARLTFGVAHVSPP